MFYNFQLMFNQTVSGFYGFNCDLFIFALKIIEARFTILLRDSSILSLQMSSVLFIGELNM